MTLVLIGDDIFYNQIKVGTIDPALQPSLRAEVDWLLGGKEAQRAARERIVQRARGNGWKSPSTGTIF
jgi:hypothetical protein